MSLSSTTNRNDYVGTGLVSIYAYSFKVFATSDLLVTTKDTNNLETTLVLDTDYTVSGAGNSSGGNVTLTAGSLTLNYAITIRRKRPLKQSTDIRNQGDFSPETHEDTFDHLIMIDQQQQDEIDRGLKLPETVAGSSVDPVLPTPVAEKFIKVNAAANGFEFASLTAVGSVTVPGSNGVAVYTGGNVFTARTLTGTAGQIGVVDGDGQSGNPTFSIADGTSFTVANGQVAAADVTGLVFASATYRGAIVRYDITRKTDTASSEVRSIGDLILTYNTQDSAWSIILDKEHGDPHGVTFTVTAVGQVQYVSNTIAGSNYAGNMKFRNLELFKT